jgi:glycosyltransferase involved in cell wall biosynthesis
MPVRGGSPSGIRVGLATELEERHVRIALLTNLFPPESVGGYELLAADVVERLRRRGHEVEVWTSGADASGSSVEAWPSPATTASGAVHRRLELERAFSFPAFEASERWRALWRRAVVARTNRRRLTEAWRRSRPDVVLVFSQLRLGLGGARAAESLGLPVVYAVNDAHLLGFKPSDGLRAPYDRSVGRETTWQGLRFGTVLCISALLRDQLVAGGAPLRHARVVPQGVDLQLFSRRTDLPARPTRLLYVGQLLPYKGVHTVLEAAARLRTTGRDVGVTLVGAGDEAYTRTLRDLARREALDVSFAGRVPRTELPAVYRAHDAFVFPSIWKEPFGLTFLEAMASGTPVISTVEGGQRELLRDGVNAVTFTAGDPTALAHAVCRLDDEALRSGITTRARRDVERRHDLDSYVDAIEDASRESVDAAAPHGRVRGNGRARSR